jgi:hypothetical protein
MNDEHLETTLLLLRIMETKGYNEMDALGQAGFAGRALKANRIVCHILKRAWERAQAEGHGVVDRKEKLGLVDSIQSGPGATHKIVDPST